MNTIYTYIQSSIYCPFFLFLQIFLEHVQTTPDPHSIRLDPTVFEGLINQFIFTPSSARKPPHLDVLQEKIIIPMKCMLFITTYTCLPPHLEKQS